MSKNNLKTASVLSFERKMANSDGLMYSCQWNQRHQFSAWEPLTIQEKAVRGTISNRLPNKIASDDAKLNAEVEKANLQKVDVTAIPFNRDTLKLSFSLRVLGNLTTPSTCNDPDYQKALTDVIEQYIEAHQFELLAKRYAVNLANGRFLWRNRIGAEQIEVRVTYIENQEESRQWVFDAYSFSLRNFSYHDPQIDELAEVIRQGLMGDSYTFLKVEAFVLVGEGQEVFPSQELVLDSGNVRGKKSKFLYKVNDVAAMHSQKIGNALRSIDTWYPEADELGPIAVEPYGSVTNRGTAYRKPTQKIDFYHLFDGWVVKNKIPTDDQQHYVMACLIRGGVFGEKAD